MRIQRVVAPWLAYLCRSVVILAEKLPAFGVLNRGTHIHVEAIQAVQELEQHGRGLPLVGFTLPDNCGWTTGTTLEPLQRDLPSWKAVGFAASRRSLLFVKAPRHDRGAMCMELHKLEGRRTIDPNPSGEIAEAVATQPIIFPGDVEPLGLGKPFDQSFVRGPLGLGIG